MTKPALFSQNFRSTFATDILTALMFALATISGGFYVASILFADTGTKLANIISYSVLIPSVLFVFIRRARTSTFNVLCLHLSLALIYIDSVYLILCKIEYGSTVFMTSYLGVILAVNMLRSLLHRIQTKSDHLSYDAFICLAAFQVIAYLGIANNQALRNSVMCNAVFMVCFYFAARQLLTFRIGYDHYLNSSTQPVREIKKQNRFTVFVALCGVGLALLALIVIPIDAITDVVTLIGKLIFGLIMKIIVMFSESSDKRGFEEDAKEIAGQTEMNENPILSMIAEIISIIIVVVACVILVIIAVRSLRLLFKRLRSRKHLNELPKDEKELLVVDIIEDIPEAKKRKSSRKLDFGTGYEKQIRMKYFKTVSKAIKGGAIIHRSSSPRQIEAILKEKGDPSISELTSQYESVRYNK